MAVCHLLLGPGLLLLERRLTLGVEMDRWIPIFPTAPLLLLYLIKIRTGKELKILNHPHGR